MSAVLAQGELQTEHDVNALGCAVAGVVRQHTHRYHALRGTRDALRGDAAREEAAREMPLSDVMTRLKQGLISGSEFMQLLLSRSADDMAAVCPSLNPIGSVVKLRLTW